MLERQYVKLDEPAAFESHYAADFSDPEHVLLGNNNKDFVQQPCKKHGVWCKAKKLLNIRKKKNRNDKHHLFEDDDLKGSLEKLDEFENKINHGRRRNIHDWIHTKQMTYSSPKTKKSYSKKARCDKTMLIGDEELIDECEETTKYKGKHVNFRVLQDRYDLLQEVTVVEQEFVVTLDDKSDDDEIIVATMEVSDVKGGLSTKEYIKKQWKGKRAKKARKRVRRFVGRSWVYFKAGITSSGGTNSMDITSATTALIAGMSKDEKY